MTARYLLILMLCLCSPGTAHGDLNQYMVRTTEWLVDHSSVICVAEFDDEKPNSIRKVLTTIKGDATALNRTPKKPSFDGYPYFAPPAGGAVRLLFIGENQELWQAVTLRRYPTERPTLHDVFYGVDQYGQIHLTESSLMDAIRAHMAAKPSKSVTRRKSSPHFGRSGIEAPPYFPFESGGETFVLVVDFTERRRDFYLSQLKSGDCAERLHAIRELSQLEDTMAHAAIEAATRASGVSPSHMLQWSYRGVPHQSDRPDDMVRNAARDALKRIAEGRPQ